MPLPRVIFAGVAEGDTQTRRELNELDFGEKWAPSPGITNRLFVGFEIVLDLADDENFDGAHILAFHLDVSRRGVEARRDLVRRLGSRHRVAWLEFRLHECGSDEFRRRVLNAIHVESAWRDSIRPVFEHSPLRLPECSFDAYRGVRDMWMSATSVRCADDIDNTMNRIKAFASRHHFVSNDSKRRGWRDERELEFTRADPGAFHYRRAPRERRWKFTVRLADGFHFDVRHARNERSSVISLEGRSCPFTGHTNVDCHGFVLGKA